jgi:hypothetical protein
MDIRIDKRTDGRDFSLDIVILIQSFVKTASTIKKLTEGYTEAQTIPQSPSIFQTKESRLQTEMDKEEGR